MTLYLDSSVLVAALLEDEPAHEVCLALLRKLSGADVIDAIGESERAGVRGGAILDFLHLVAARRSAATALYTLNHRHFVAVARKGDPKIEEPG